MTCDNGEHKLPSTLTELRVTDDEDDSYTKLFFIVPPSLTKLTIDFEMGFALSPLPSSLTHLHVTNGFYKVPIDCNLLPHSLQYLNVGEWAENLLNKSSLPPTLINFICLL